MTEKEYHDQMFKLKAQLAVFVLAALYMTWYSWPGRKLL